MKTILAATDLSERSRPALDRAKAMARRTGAALMIVHVVDDDQPRELIERQIDQAQSFLDAELGDRPAGLSLSHQVVTGDAYWALRSVAADVRADLLVVGDHRRSRLRDAFRDTTVERLIRVTPCPVLLGRLPAADGYECAIVGVESEEAPELLRGLAVLGDAGPRRLSLLSAFDAAASGLLAYAGTPQNEIEKYRAEVADGIREKLFSSVSHHLGQRVGIRVVEAEPASALEEAAREEECDLIVVSTHARRGVHRRIVGSVSSALIRHGARDLLVVPRPGSPSATDH